MNLMLALLTCLVFISIADATQKKRNCTDGKPQEPYPAIVKNTTVLLKEFRKLMRKHGIQAYIIPSEDDHQTEYVAPWFKRRQFISGFTGSAGTAVITLKHALLWVDGRYHDQSETQVDCNWIIQKQGDDGVPSITEWLRRNMVGQSVGADPRVISITYYRNIVKVIERASIKWVNVNENLVDAIWPSRPVPTESPVFIQPLKYAGQNVSSKIDNLRQTMKEQYAMAIVIQALDDVAWLLNLRGNDIPYNPFFYSYVTVAQDKISLFVDLKKINNPVKRYLSSGSSKYCVTVNDYNYTLLGEHLRDLVKQGNQSIWVTPKSSLFLSLNVPEKRQLVKYSPIQLPKARKNKQEILGMKSANIKDGIAIMEYFVWLKKQIADGRRVTEITGGHQLKYFKSLQENFVELSFTTLSSFGPNGAIIHYVANNYTDTAITDKSLYLLDSGAQFYEGSTDITRTIHLGTPTAFQKEVFTYVLKGAIRLAMAIFPTGTYGRNIDAFARQSLWDHGLDYRHGTGHGIGSFLSIHEGPGKIYSGKLVPSETPLYEGMVFSDEPGYYEYGNFGIRLETAVHVVKKSLKYYKLDRTFYGFEAITFVPFEKKLINIEMLTKIEIDWLNKYNVDIRKIMGAELKKQGKTEVYDYMMELTEPIKTKKEKTSSSSVLYFSFTLMFSTMLSGYLLC